LPFGFVNNAFESGGARSINKPPEGNIYIYLYSYSSAFK
jgi:hypothetical protein